MFQKKVVLLKFIFYAGPWYRIHKEKKLYIYNTKIKQKLRIFQSLFLGYLHYIITLWQKIMCEYLWCLVGNLGKQLTLTYYHISPKNYPDWNFPLKMLYMYKNKRKRPCVNYGYTSEWPRMLPSIVPIIADFWYSKQCSFWITKWTPNKQHKQKINISTSFTSYC